MHTNCAVLTLTLFFTITFDCCLHEESGILLVSHFLKQHHNQFKSLCSETVTEQVNLVLCSPIPKPTVIHCRFNTNLLKVP